MKVIDYLYPSEFNFWGGAKQNAESLTMEQLDSVNDILEEMYPDGIESTTLNDLFWFEFDEIKNWIGID